MAGSALGLDRTISNGRAMRVPSLGVMLDAPVTLAMVELTVVRNLEINRGEFVWRVSRVTRPPASLAWGVQGAAEW